MEPGVKPGSDMFVGAAGWRVRLRREVGAGLRNLFFVQWPCELWEGLGLGSDVIRPVFRQMTWARKLWVRKAAWAGEYRDGASSRLYHTSANHLSGPERHPARGS